MGSCLQIGDKEINSKWKSKIIIDAIRDLDIMTKRYIHNYDGEKWFKADRYDENGIGYGDYVLRRKGLALLVLKLKSISENNDLLMEMAADEYNYYLANICQEEQKESEVIRLKEEVKEDVLWCLSYVSAALANMIYAEKKTIDVQWK